MWPGAEEPQQPASPHQGHSRQPQRVQVWPSRMRQGVCRQLCFEKVSQTSLFIWCIFYRSLLMLGIKRQDIKVASCVIIVPRVLARPWTSGSTYRWFIKGSPSTWNASIVIRHFTAGRRGFGMSTLITSLTGNFAFTQIILISLQGVLPSDTNATFVMTRLTDHPIFGLILKKFILRAFHHTNINSVVIPVQLQWTSSNVMDVLSSFDMILCTFEDIRNVRTEWHLNSKFTKFSCSTKPIFAI